MSTSYYYLRPPFTAVKVSSKHTYDKVSVWVDGVIAGSLVVPKGKGPDVCSVLADSDVSVPPMEAWYGGPDEGVVVKENVMGLDPALTLVSEYGEPTTVWQVRAEAGRGKRG